MLSTNRAATESGPTSCETRPTWDYAVIRDHITAERLTSYLNATNGDLKQAFRLYEWNMAAAGGVLSTMAMVEVVLRNALDDQLCAWVDRRHPERSWFDVTPLDRQGRSDVDKARRRATRNHRRAEIHGKVVAELSLGFWRYLTASRYLTSIWVPCLHQAFSFGPADLRQRRVAVEHHLQELLFVRNRAAHHEPIHRRDLGKDFAAAVELIGWTSRDAAAWIADVSPLPGLTRDRPRQ